MDITTTISGKTFCAPDNETQRFRVSDVPNEVFEQQMQAKYAVQAFAYSKGTRA